MTRPLPLAAATPLEQRVAWIDRFRASEPADDGWSDLLAEQSVLFKDLSANDAARLRAYALGGFEAGRLPEALLPLVVEDLTYSRDPRVAAAAAVGLRSAAVPPEAAPDLLIDALRRMLGRDDVVDVGRFGQPAPDCSTTAVSELLATLAWLGPRAARQRSALVELQREGCLPGAAMALTAMAAQAERPAPGPACCCKPAAATLQHCAEVTPGALHALELQDQDGVIARFADIFAGAPSLIAFFYTRCMTPEKCSLTISRLGELRRKLRADQPGIEVNIAGVTYDPAYDEPSRMRAFGTHRNVEFDGRTKLLRTTGGFEALQDAFALGVGFGPTTVNLHRIDLLILDSRLTLRGRIARSQWELDAVAARLVELGSAAAAG